MNGQTIRVLELSGSPYEMGYAHGSAYREAIRHFAEERVRLSGDPLWTGRALPRPEVLTLAEACVEAHRCYAPELLDELQGMAEATDLTLAELVVVNGFTDFIDTVYNAGTPVRQVAHTGADNCTAFLVPDDQAAEGHGFFGQTWDMHSGATPHVVLLRGRPQAAPAFLAFTTVGCVGMIGLNEAGVAVGINNLLGADGKVGVTWPFAIRRMLMAEDAEGALEALTSADLAGAHNYLVLDATGHGYNVEAHSTRHHITELGGEALVHTNHCLADATRAVERPREPASQASSEERQKQAENLLKRQSVTPEDLQALTRDESSICVRSAPPKHVETCGAVVVRPATRDFWAVWGLPSENTYEHFTLS